MMSVAEAVAVLAIRWFLRIRGAVVPVAKLEALAFKALAQGGSGARLHDGQHAALVAVVAAKRGGDAVGRLEVMALEAELLVGVADDDEVAGGAANERGEIRRSGRRPSRRRAARRPRRGGARAPSPEARASPRRARCGRWR